MSEGLEARRRESQAVEGLVCPKCGRSLLVFSGAQVLIFYCKSGHDWPLQNLLRSPSRLVRPCVQRLADEWRRKAQALRLTISQALLDNRADVADTFRREATTLEARIQILTSSLESPGGARRPQSAIEPIRSL